MATADNPVAVVGIACRLPGAENCRDFWKLLTDSVDTVNEFPSERAVDIQHVTQTLRDKLDSRNVFFSGSFFKSVDTFDESMFGISRKEALYIEPEQRIFLETVYELLEDAGMTSRIRGTRTGVYVGHTVNKYKYILTDNHPSISHGNHPPFIASRVSYTFDLHGPALMVATGCSSSLLAVHLACQGLVGDDCEMAIAGGITLDLLPFNMKTDIWNQLGITGDGIRCRPFDSSANGIAKGEGCGAVFLKPLHKAIEDRDYIYGVLLSSVANQDGRSNGITAPHPMAQADMLVRAWTKAKILPNHLSYIEAHGTGTLLGDPIEICGIENAFKVCLGREHKVYGKPIPIQSVKANIGHLADGAAGVVSLIKVLLCLRFESIPPAMHFDRPNQHIDWKKSPVYVNTVPLDWPHRLEQRRTAGVSSFGLLGTNIHLVVTEHSRIDASKASVDNPESTCPAILTLSAQTKKSLSGIVKRYAEFLSRCESDCWHENLRDIFYTANITRHHETFGNRVLVAASSFAEAAAYLRDLDFEQHCNEPVQDIDTIVHSGGATYRLDMTLSNAGSRSTVNGKWYVDYLAGMPVDWKTIYSGASLKRVPLLPSYFFDRKRFWPDVTKSSINDRILVLEHSTDRLKIAADVVTSCYAGNQATKISARKKLEVCDVLKQALNEAVQKEIDWEVHKHDNLFGLGIDSLMCIMIINILRENLGNDCTFSVREFHDNPTFEQLHALLISRHITKLSSETTDVQTEFLVQNNKSEFVVSSSQQRLWVMQQVCLNKCAYNCCNGLLIEGPLESVALNAAVEYVTSRNATFSTTFTSQFHSDADDNHAMALKQVIHWDMKHSVKRVDLRTNSYPAEARRIASELFTDDYKADFNLEAGPLVRFCLYHITDDECLFTMVVHHIIFDGSSHFVFWNQLWDAYAKVLNNECVDKCEIITPLYAQIAEKEQCMLKTERAKNDLSYWRKKLALPLPMTTLCGDKCRPVVFTNKGNRITTFLDVAGISALTDAAEGKHTTFTALLSSVFVLMHRFTGHADMVIGFPVAARQQTEARRIIGCFVNTVAVRLQVDEAETFVTLMDQVSRECADVYDHQHVPFDWIVKELGIARATDVSPIFNVSVTFHNTEAIGDHVDPPSELTVERCLPHNDSAKWDLYFDFLEETSTGNLRFTLEYYTDLYSDKYAEIVVNAFISTLKSVSENPSVSIGKLPLLLPAQELAFSAGLRQRFNSDTLPVLLLKEAKASTSRVAITSADNSKEVTYGHLLKSAAELAAFIREHCKLMAESRIGLLIRNSVESVTAVFAIILAGFSYVPLDACLPHARLETLCNEATVKLIIFGANNFHKAVHLRWACPSVDGIVCLDRSTFAELREASGNPLMDRELWDYVADSGLDDIQAGGWKSSYTGAYFTECEMAEYAGNVKTKTERYLSKNSVVVEIGCGSGLTTQMLCPLVAKYIATDVSSAMVKRLEKTLGQEFSNLTVLCLEANSILQELSHMQGQIDVILLNSVVHCFPGHAYFMHVMNQVVQLLAPAGVLFIGDVMDQSREENLVNSLSIYKRSHPEAKTKLDWSNELFLSRSFLDLVLRSIPALESLEISGKLYTIPNELTEFRFDAIFRKEAEAGCGYSIDAVFHSMGCFAAVDIKRHDGKRQLDGQTTATEEMLEQWARSVANSDDAYVLYTSGTTGAPKGIVISHGALLNYVSTAAEMYGLDSETVVPLFSPLTFDFTVTMLLCPLLKGGKIVVFAPFLESYDQIANRRDLTIAKFSPLQLEIILSSDRICRFPLSIKVFIIGGEALSKELLNSLWRRQENNKFVVFNEYGPTEATVGCIVKRFTDSDFPMDNEAVIPIGVPFANCVAAVVNSQMQVVPVGAKGRLCLGGAQLCKSFAGTRGSKSTKWTKSFITTPLPSSASFGEQLLLTDDIASLNPSGQFLYHGRCSSGIVKINGVRVDLVEIKLVLERICGVKQAWVCTVDDLDGRTLIGAALQIDTAPEELNVLRQLLRLQLPPNSIPKLLIHIETPPINANGKVDMDYISRMLLSEHHKQPTMAERDEQQLNIASSEENTIMLQIQRIWMQVFSAARLPKIDDDFFFDLGGDSLLAIHAVRRMNQQGFAVSVAELFQHSTIRSIAHMCFVQEYQAVDIREEQNEEGLTFIPTPIVADFFDLLPIHPDHYALPALLKFACPAGIKISDVDKALELVIEKHIALRSTFSRNGDSISQHVCGVRDMFHGSEEITVLQSKDVAQLIFEPQFIECCDRLENSLAVYDGPVFTSAIIRYAGNKFAVLVAHHLVIDVVSWNIVLDDFAEILGALQEKNTSPDLSKPKTSYALFCEKLRSTDYFLAQESYWSMVVVQMASENCGKLTTKASSQPPTFDGAKFLSVSVRTTSASAEHVTLLAALSKALRADHGHQWTAICLEMHGRDFPVCDLTETVGWCTCRFSFVLKSTVEEIQSDLKALPNCGLGYSILHADNELPRLMFVYLGSLGSTVTTFGIGNSEFSYTPWIEVMVHELQGGRFHRHGDEKMEFDAEIIAWRFNDVLKVGVLFNDDILDSSVAKTLIANIQDYYDSNSHSQDIFNTTEQPPVKLTNCIKESANIKMLSSFELTPDCVSTASHILRDLSVNADLISCAPDELFAQMHTNGHHSIYIFILYWTSVESYRDFATNFQETRSIRGSASVIIINVSFKYQATNECSTVLADLVKSHENETVYNLSTLVADQFDERSYQRYNMPLTQFGYYYLGCTIGRVLNSALQPTSYKVIAVDADYTLWEGECANGNVAVTETARLLQEFLKRKINDGFLLVLVSKNNQDDVKRVFRDNNADMILKLDDFVDVIANWQPKHNNLMMISRRLNLGIDSFVVIDDNPAECSSITAALPKACVVQGPLLSSLMSVFLDRLWMLDKPFSSFDDKLRTKRYQTEMRRKVELDGNSGVSGNTDIDVVLRRWEMKLTVVDVLPHALQQSSNAEICGRAQELLQRTNQFKLNSIHTDMNKLSSRYSWLVSLKDNFGCYGIVSVLMYHAGQDELIVDQWVLSCRALNRKVENTIFKLLEIECGSKNLSKLTMKCQRTEKNIPAVQFLQSVGFVMPKVTKEECEKCTVNINGSCSSNGWTIPVDKTSDLKSVDTAIQTPIVAEVKTSESTLKALSRSEISSKSFTAFENWINSAWRPELKSQCNAKAIYPLISLYGHTREYQNFNRQEIASTFSYAESAKSDLEKLWMEVLHLERTPQLADDFFEIGGNSFCAVFLTSKIRRDMGVDLQLSDIFNCKTFEALLKLIQEKPSGDRLRVPESIPSSLLADRQLTTAEQRMLLMQRISPDSTAYVETMAICHRFEQTQSTCPKLVFEKLVELYPALSTFVRGTDSDAQMALSLCDVHVSSQEADCLEDGIKLLTDTKSTITMSRLAIFHHVTIRHDNVHIFAVHVHHILADDVSLRFLAKATRELLDADGCSKVSTTTANNSNYLQFESHDYIKSEDYQRDLAFWKDTISSNSWPENRLPGGCRAHNFMYDTLAASYHTEKIDRDVVTSIRQYCKSVKSTEFQFYLACFLVALQRYTVSGLLVVAVPVTTRTDEFQDTFGLFVNTLPFRFDVDMRQTFRQFLDAVSTAWIRHFDHRLFPFDRIVRILRDIYGTNGGTPCLMFNYANQTDAPKTLFIPNKHAKMPMSLDVIGRDDIAETRLVLEFAKDIVDSDVARRFLDSFVTTCQTVIAPERSDILLVELDVLSVQEQHLLRVFQTGGHDEKVSAESTWVHPLTMFEQNVTEHPNDVAVVFEEKSLKYRELNDQANHVAEALRSAVFPNILQTQPVFLIMDKTIGVIAAVFGVWKAGGYFLTVSQTTLVRLNAILKRCSPAAVITNLDNLANSDTMSRLTSPVLKMSECLQVGHEQNQIASMPGTTAYVMFTSGSTGEPKQCQISSNSLSCLAQAWKSEYGLKSFPVILLQWAPMCFDVFVGDLVKALVSSCGTLVICPENRRLDVDYVTDLIARNMVTAVELTPQFAAQIIDYKPFLQTASTIRLFVVGSDVTKRNLFSKCKEKLSTARVVNSYGMTEATIDSSYFEGECPSTLTGTVPIGKPLPGVVFCIVDRQSKLPVPIGTAGELCIGGLTVAAGDIAAADYGNGWGRLLETGDSARWLNCGNVEHLGRLDATKKVRGYRVNTDEIEEKIKANVKGIKQAHVTVVSDDEYGESLCAFVVPEQAELHTRQQVRESLSNTLPLYSMPDQIHVLKSIPLTPNGKLDNEKLQTLAQIRECSGPNIYYRKHEPLTRTERKLCELLAEAIGYADSNSVDVHRTFMEQGAHSLTLLRFSALVQQRMDLPLAVSTLFSYPSIEQLSRHLDGEHSQTHFPVDYIANTSNDADNDEALDRVAIVGAGMRLPGKVTSIGKLWEVLESGIDVFGPFPDNRAADVINCAPRCLRNKLQSTGTFRGAFLQNIDHFDHEFFGIAPNEAKYMAPEQRLFLTVATEALLDADMLADVYGSNVGVFVGASEIGYTKLQTPDEAVCIAGELPSIIASRVAYHYDLKGKTVVVDTACSSSMVALQMACDAVRRGDCEAALVGGVSLVFYPTRVGVHGDHGILSPDFECRSFDRDADGTAVGEGVMCLVLKPLSSALRDGNNLYGVVSGSASNSVGRGNGITAPSSLSQKAVIENALKSARCDSRDVSYVEGHGTGTKLGDGIEISAIRDVFANNEEPVTVGSVKANFGHLDAAAGLLGVLKVLAQFAFQTLPRQVHFNSPHPALDTSNLRIIQGNEQWRCRKHLQRRIAGISSFGLSGTNCHVILEEPPSTEGAFLSLSVPVECPLVLPFLSKFHLSEQAAILLHFVRIHQRHIRDVSVQQFTACVANKCKQLVRLMRNKFRKANSFFLRLLAFDVDSYEQIVTRLEQIASAEEELEEQESFRILSDTALLDLPACNAAIPGLHLSIFSCHRHWLEVVNVKTYKHDSGVMIEDQLEITQLLATKWSTTRELVRQLQLAPPAKLQQSMDQFCTSIIVTFLRSTPLNNYWKAGIELSFDDAFCHTEMHRCYAKLFFVMLRQLRDVAVIISVNEQLGSFEILQSFDEVNVDSAARLAQFAEEKYPAYADCFKFPLYCSEHYRQVLVGKKDPLSVIYPKGDMDFMYQFHRLGDLLGDVYYNMYMQLVAQFVSCLSRRSERPIRILEVGAGVGHVTRQLIPKLAGVVNFEYWFTDIGKAFVNNAAKVFSDYSLFMRYAVFDITKPAHLQGLKGTFDIILSYNVIHTTKSIRQSVSNLHSTLSETGTLFIIESSKNETWSTLAWGLLDGWWYFEDYDLRPHDPMLNPADWKRVLEDEHFAAVSVCPVFEEEQAHVEKFLYVCSNQVSQESSTVYYPLRGWWEESGKKSDSGNEDFMGDPPILTDTSPDKTHILDAIIDIWRKVLGVPNVLPDNEFNELGGESLLAIQMMTLVRRRIGFQLEIAHTFAYPTPNLLASFIFNELTSDSETAGPSAPAIMNSMNSSYANTLMRRTMIVFPGQGAQKQGMCKTLIDSEGARKVFAAASAVLGYSLNLEDVICEEQQQLLSSTESVQILLFVSSLAKVEQLKETEPDLVRSVSCVAGLSVGEIAALVFAEALDFGDGLRYVQQRGRLMEDEVCRRPSGMVSVFGPTTAQLKEFLEKKFPTAEISTYLADNQHCVAASKDVCTAMVELLMTRYKDEMQVIDARVLRVAGGFHSSYMQTASARLSNAFEGLRIRTPRIPITMNYSGKITDDPKVIKDELGKQIAAPVLWRDCMISAVSAGVRHFVEISPSRVLSSIVQNRIEECKKFDCTQNWISI